MPFVYGCVLKYGLFLRFRVGTNTGYNGSKTHNKVENGQAARVDHIQIGNTDLALIKWEILLRDVRAYHYGSTSISLLHTTIHSLELICFVGTNWTMLNKTLQLENGYLWVQDRVCPIGVNGGDSGVGWHKGDTVALDSHRINPYLNLKLLFLSL